MTRFCFLAVVAMATTFVFGTSTKAAPPIADIEADVCVYGGTSGGVVAAIQAARMGKSVVLLEPGEHLGGMTAGGLSAVDIGDPRSVGGLAREYLTRLVGSYGKTLAWDKPFEGKGGPATGGAFAIEPHTAERLFEEMAREAKVRVYRNSKLSAVLKQGAKIAGITTEAGALFRAKMYIDATYEGDLMAKAEVSYTLTREGNAKYGETYNGIHYSPSYQPRLAHKLPGANGRVPGGQGVWDRDLPLDPYVVPGDAKSGLLPLVQAGEAGIPGEPAPGVQAYCFRLCLTTADNRIPIAPPPNYDPKRYELVARFIAACQKIDDDLDLRWFSKYDPLPNDKWDFNTATFGGNLPGASWEWPEATYARRVEIAKEHENYHRGLLHFLASDPRVPEKVRTEMQRFGLPRDEFQSTGGWPHQIYVREGRRMVSDLVLTEHHTFGRQVAEKSIGLGSYGTDTHEIRRIVKDGVVIREGKTAGGRGGFGPYQIGYGAIVPKRAECENLFVTFALSASHTAFSSIRMEPVLMVTSQSAATAACLAIDGKIAVQEVDYEKLKARLLADGQVLAWAQAAAGEKKGAADPAVIPASAETLALGLAPPEINTRPGPEYSDAERDYAMTIGIERTHGGRLWAAWVGGGDSDKGYFVLATSDDDGRTWSQPRLVIDPPETPSGLRRRVLVGNLWCDPTGKLWLFFDHSVGYFDGRAGDWAITCDNPDAAEPAWSPPRRIAHGATLNKPTVLSSGEWLLPISLWSRAKIGPAELREAHRDLDELRMASLFASTDAGKTWNPRGGVVFPQHDFDEHMVVERKDGSLWMLARTVGGIAESTSTDRGKTWSEPKIAIPHINARFHLRRLKSGKLLLVKHGRIDERTPSRSHLTAFVSDDDGQTWRGGLVLDERTGVSYPDGFQAPDGRIYISYDRERAKEREILLAVFSEEDVLAGKLVAENSRLKGLISKALGPKKAAIAPAKPTIPVSAPIDWEKQAGEDAKHDRTTVAYDGITPNKMVCDTTLRQLPDGSWILFMLAGGDTEPSPKNYTGITRSSDQGKTWSKLEPFDVGFPREGKTIGQGPTELMVKGGRCTLFFSTHSNHWNSDWRSWFMTSDDSCRTWTKAQPIPGRLQNRTFIRNHIIAKDGRIIVPFQHYIGPEADADKPPLARAFTNPRNGVLISGDGGKTWSEHGNVRLTENDRYFGWAENNLAELSDGRIAMIIRGDRLGGVLYYAESKDGGKTWPELASKTEIPNPGSKATLYPLGGDTVAILHNPNPAHRSPLALWISFDGLKTWPYRRVLVPESSDGPKGRLNYPDGFVTADKQFLHFAFDDNRHRAVYYGAKLPPLP